MYPTDNDPTQMIYRTNPGNSRRAWLAAGAGLLAVAVLTFLIMAAFQGRGDRSDAALAAPPSPTTSVTPAPQVDPDQEAEGGGGQVPQNPGDGPGPGQPDPGGGGQPEEEPDEDPGEEPGEEIPQYEVIPLLPTISASVSEPGLFGCVLTSAKITVTGVVFAPIEIKYQFVRFGFVDQPLGAVQSVVFDTAGEKTVTSALPKNEDSQLIYLKISAPKEIKTDMVIYPGCG